MVQEFQDRKSRLYDTGGVYGWISILLHWVTAIIVVALWIIGQSITNVSLEEVSDRRALHISIAASAWILILFRSIWRFRTGHPHVRGQSAIIHRIAVVAHYAMLIIMLLMLVSGPLMVWAGGNEVAIFNLIHVPGPPGESETVRELAWFVHSGAAMALFWLVLLHIGGALKHLMFHADDTFVRMIWPGNGSRNGGAS